MKRKTLCTMISIVICLSLISVEAFAKDYTMEEIPLTEIIAEEASIEEQTKEVPAEDILIEEQIEAEVTSEETKEENTVGDGSALKSPATGSNADQDMFYSVTAEECTGGKIEITETAYKAGDTVVFTALPDEGFVFTGAETEPKTDITKNEDGTCSFIMPETDVRIWAGFGELLNAKSGNFVNGIAISAAGYWSKGAAPTALSENGYASPYLIYKSGNKSTPQETDLNEREGGHYVYMGIKFQDEFSKNLITGVILLKNSGHPAVFEYGGKKYKPVAQLCDSNGDLNQEAGGSFLYLYYTTDGADQGDPVLTYLCPTESPDTFDEWYEYVVSVHEYTDENGTHTTVQAKQDVAENGVHYYLHPTYHTHNLSHKHDENYHWDVCNSCGYVSVKEPHEYSYSFGVHGFQHEACCDCGYKFMEDHVDADGDNKCDFCQAQLVAESDGLYFETFFGAWKYAAEQERDTAVCLLQDDDVLDTSLVLGNGRTVTLTSAGGEKKPVLMLENSIFSIENGTLVTDIDVQFSGNTPDDGFHVSGENAGLYIRSGNIIAEYTGLSGTEAVIEADNGAELILSGGNITGAARAISALECRNIVITGGKYCGDKCALHLYRASHAKVTGGTFRSDDSCSIEVITGSLKDIFPAGYHCYAEETGERVTIKDGPGSISENVTVLYKPFHISVTSEGNGTVECSEEAAYGETVQLVVKPAPGNRFEKWETSDVSVAGDHTFVMAEKDVSIKAVFAENEPVSYLDEKGKEQTVTDYGILTPDKTKLSAGWYVTSGTVSFDSRIETDGDIHLILKDGSTLDAGKGIHVGSGSALTVYAQSTGDEAGSIIASSGDNNDNAGIGGNYGESSGLITINGGDIVSDSIYAAGIGGGGGSGSLNGQYGGTGTVIVNSGKVKAGSMYGAGIGGGNYYGKGEVTINGGKVEAGSMYGAGIGGGNYYGKGEVTINGGEVIAKCDSHGAGIGGGRYGDADITINGGTVDARGKSSAAGLGCEDESYTARITITGGKIDAVTASTFTDAICAGKEGFIRLIPTNHYSLEVKTENDTEIAGSPFAEQTDITEQVKGNKEVHIKEVSKPVYTITVTTDGHGSAKAQAGGAAAEKAYAGDIVKLTAQPDEGYHFASWQSEDVTIALDGTYTMPAHAVEVKAAFEEGKLNIVNGKEASCTEDGYKPCYQCDCGKYFEDAAGSRLIPDHNAWIKGEGKIPAGHTYGKPEYTWNGDQCTAVRSCSVCAEGTSGHRETETKEGIYVKDTQATCTKAETGHYAVEKFDNPVFAPQQTEKGSAIKGEPLGHKYNAPEYMWADDQCMAVRTCSVCAEGTEGHRETEIKTGAYVKDLEATCIRAERGHYVVEKFDNPAFAPQQTKKYTVIKGEPLGHKYITGYVWVSDRCIANGVCRVCREGMEGHSVTETKIGEYIMDTEANCAEAETGHYVVDQFDNPAFSSQQTEKGSVVKGEPLGHKYGEPTYSWDDYLCTAERVCSVCDESLKGHRETETQVGIFIKDTEATCTKAETGHYVTRTFENPAFEAQHTDKCLTVRGKPLGHKYEEPNYTFSGNEFTAVRVCSVCPEGTDGHSETEVRRAFYVKDTDATCTTPEMGHYVVDRFNNPAFLPQQTEKNSEINGKPLGHDYKVQQYDADVHRYVCQHDNSHFYTEEHLIESDTCLICGFFKNSSYLILYGAGSEWTKGSGEDCLIISDAPFEKFVRVTVDEKVLSETDYAVHEGSTEITLKAGYLETLSTGAHTIEIVSTDGSATTFFVVNPSKEPPEPSEPSEPSGPSAPSVSSGTQARRSFTVTFRMNGHGMQIPAQTVRERSAALKPADPSAAGYTFGGWYADSAFTVPFDFAAALYADATVYAKWEKSPTGQAIPNTGDDSNLMLWLCLALAELALFLAAVAFRKKNRS